MPLLCPCLQEGDLKALESLGAMGWVNSTWEGELGTDRWLRGAWRRPDAGGAGRWRARHIGRAAVHGTMKPQARTIAIFAPNGRGLGGEWGGNGGDVRGMDIEDYEQCAT